LAELVAEAAAGVVLRDCAWGACSKVFVPVRAVLQFICSIELRARWIFLKEKPLIIVPSVYCNWRTAIRLAPE